MYTKEQLELILNTLPIGYYIKRNVPVTLDMESETSYYNQSDDLIRISYKQLKTALKVCPEQEYLEENVRSILYHEISHAFLTPDVLFECEPPAVDFTFEQMDSIINIFEDERIESVLRYYYYKTDFRQFVKRLNHYHGEEPRNANEAFYHLVRFRVGPDYWLNEVHNIIIKYKSLTNFKRSNEKKVGPRGFIITQSMEFERIVEDYVNEILDLYKRFTYNWTKTHQELKRNNKNGSTTGQTAQNQMDAESANTQTEQNNSNGNTTQANTPTNESSLIQSNNQNETSNKVCSAPSCGESSAGDYTPLVRLDKELNLDQEESEQRDITRLEQGEFDSEYIHELFDTIFNSYSNAELDEKIDLLLSRIKKNNKQNGSAINSYSGVFDVRSVIRDDYKYFVQKNRMGSAKAFAKTQLNLFIDCSGSFKRSETKVNELLHALTKFEQSNPDFTYNLVTCGEGSKYHDKQHRHLVCNGGNNLTKEIHPIFRSLQNTQANTYNIVLFDGNAYSNCWRRSDDFNNFGAFDTHNTTIISDYENKRYIKPTIHSAKVVYTNNYTDELFEHVFDALYTFTRI